MAYRYIYNTAGNYVAFVTGGHLFSPDAQWLGFITTGNEVYDTKGHYAGVLLDDDRIVRRKNEQPRSRILVPLTPLTPLRPLRPLKRLRMPRIQFPYEDVFETTNGSMNSPLTKVDKHKFDHLLGAKIYAADGQLLGLISKNKYDAESLTNPYGSFGSKYNQFSIFNKYGAYGSKYSPMSPFNQYTSTPPKITMQGRLLGQLTLNRYLSDAIDPNEFINWLSEC